MEFPEHGGISANHVMARLASLIIATISFGNAVLLPNSAAAQQVHRNGFEGRETLWLRGSADASCRETAHAITDLHAHGGQRSEHIELTTETGTFVYYYYPIPSAPIGSELSASLFLKANRPGLRLMARVVLPHEKNPANLQENLTTYLRGDVYQLVGRWQRLELRGPVKLAREQQQFMRGELKRDIIFTDAYIDRLMLNVYGGPGQTDVWIDDLEVGPVLNAASFQPTSRPLPGAAPSANPKSATVTPLASSPVALQGDRLDVAGKGFFFRGIRHSDTPLRTLRDAGLNTIWFDYRTPREVVDEAVSLGFWVVPTLPVTVEDPRLATVDAIRHEIGTFTPIDAVLFWDLGGGLVEENRDRVQEAARAVRALDANRPVAADVWDGYSPYCRALDLVGAHRWPLMTSLGLIQYRDWLAQRRNLGRPGHFAWTWVQTHLPDWFCRLVYDRPAAAGFNEPVGPQPEQIRLLTYIALGSGCRGIGFWSDRFLANSHQGRDRLLEMALLNMELQMLEPLLVTTDRTRWIDTSNPEVKAAVLKTEYGLLVLPVWLGDGSQFVPGQSAAASLDIVVPDAPPGTDPWQITPVEVHTIPVERVVGGSKITIPHFSQTAAVLFTSYSTQPGILVRFQNQTRHLREQAAQWAKDLAGVELDKVSQIAGELEKSGHALEDGAKLLEEARRRFRVCLEHWNSHAYRDAYLEADEAVRPLRILMRAHWEKAIKGLDIPTASPYAVSFFTLPRHYQFVDRLRQSKAGANVLREGDFEDTDLTAIRSWTTQQTHLDSIVIKSPQRVTESPKEGKKCLLLEIAAPPGKAAPEALERTFLAYTSPPVQLPPGTPVRISAWMRIPAAIGASVDGALIYDSAAGEPLGVRQIAATGWKKFTLYRTAPDSGMLQVTLALTGIGKAYFDDIRIEPLMGGADQAARR